MELSWSTFLLEGINFLVLIWILKRFLYGPVLAVMARRRAAIEAQLAEAQSRQQQAEAMSVQYQGRLADWEKERQRLKAALALELDAQKQRHQAALEEELAASRAQAQAADARQEAQRRRQQELQALAQGATFASRLLAKAAGPELEARLFELLLAGLAGLDEQQQAALAGQGAVQLASAYPLPEAARARLEAELARLLGQKPALNYREQPELLAGFELKLGDWLLEANLREELRGLAELDHG
ncbi:F0F1 ATP synthase subunit delta [Gallaecimonas kandeliae]|uniref:F0F1 ATP synthase subunit delta n=1 Tax=Gallaecimonas kandeliae TaxID=3029055 RepID=UPI0026474E96|nr:F0F1 ATP synthase subunit delta [Gallaecimonas kandeliae]WKE64217.1 F0F1 ATP synthase subunit delta [Gallaecimonas kandeliae]